MSVAFHASDLVSWCGGSLTGGSGARVCRSVGIDSRAVEPESVFVAIRGPHHDGHAFLGDALRAGAAALVVERGVELPEGAAGRAAIVAVPDTTAALGAIAHGHRTGFTGPVVGITGSNGKTSTKEMCAAILSEGRSCLATRGNLNNQFGLPLTLLRREADHEAIVVELGTNHPGEIATLAAIAAPDVGVLTNVGTAHIEFLGSREGIAHEKGALLEVLPADGVAVVNADDPLVLSQAHRTRARLLRFGRGADADVRAERVASRGASGFAFELVAPEGRVAVEVAGLGETTIANALAAAAAALAAGAPLGDVATGLAAVAPVGGRLAPVALPDDVMLLDDTYNASPQSMEIALRSLSALKGAGRGVAVLGDMGELGDSAATAHRDAGRLVAELGIEFLFALGERAGEVIEGAVAAGMDPGRAHLATDHAAAAAHVRELLHRRDWVLVKGSRAMHMERIVAALSDAEAH